MILIHYEKIINNLEEISEMQKKIKKDFLIGKIASPEIEQQIREAALSIPQVLEVLDLRTMQIGVDKLLVNLEVHMKDKLTTDELEILIDKIKRRVKKEVPSIGHIQVELESPDR